MAHHAVLVSPPCGTRPSSSSGGVSQAYQGFPNAVASLLPEGERICQSHVEDRHKILGHDAAVATNDPAANVSQERVSKSRHRPTG